MPRIAIVTGGGSGIGAALGQALVRRGAAVVLADIDQEAVTKQADLLSKDGPGTADSAVVDVRDADAVTRLIQDTHRAHGRLDLLVNDAGIAVGGEPEELLLAHWERTLDVNLRGVIHGCHAAYPVMKEQGGGHILNVASLAGLMPGSGLIAPYTTTKYAVVGLSLALRAAGADAGVRVSVVCPGWIDTPIIDKRGPEDLPAPPSLAGLETRQFLAEQRISLYPAHRLADDVLRGVDRNKAIIIAPGSARIAALITRLAPAFANSQALLTTRRFRDRARLPTGSH
jgi:NAD(P)-dependent dehydrogenase (short-subunit alcohol dehydrogenase family)